MSESALTKSETLEPPSASASTSWSSLKRAAMRSARAKCLFILLLVHHRNFDAVLSSEIDGIGITGIGVAGDAHTWIGRQHSLQTSRGFGRAIGHDDLSGVDA